MLINGNWRFTEDSNSIQASSGINRLSIRSIAGIKWIRIYLDIFFLGKKTGIIWLRNTILAISQLFWLSPECFSQKSNENILFWLFNFSNLFYISLGQYLAYNWRYVRIDVNWFIFRIYYLQKIAPKLDFLPVNYRFSILVYLTLSIIAGFYLKGFSQQESV